MDLLSTHEFRIRSLGAYAAVAPGEVKLRAEVQCSTRDDAHMERVVRVITNELTVRAAAWSIPDENAAQWIGLVPD